MAKATNIEKGKKKQLESVRLTPYRCLACGKIQLKYAEPGNCDRFGCESDEIERWGPPQRITFVVYQDHVRTDV